MHGDRTHAIEMALPLTTDDEMRCISRVRSRTSFLADTMRFPRLRKKPSVDSPNTPDISTAVGWKSSLSI